MKQKKKNGYNLDDFGLLFSEASEKSKNILLRKKNAESKLDSAKSQNLHSKSPFCHSEQSEESQKNNIVILSKAKNLKNNQNRDSSVASLPQNDNVKKARNDDSALDSTKIAESSNPPTPKNPHSKDQDFIYAPQFKGFDEILAQNEDFGTQNFNVQDFSPQDFSTQTQSAESNTKAIPPSEKDLLLRHPHTQNDTNALFVAYSILFLMLLIFMPQVYLANNIYTSSKNINYLKSQKDALRDENSDLQKRLESVKFNFLTLEIEEIK